MFPWLFVGGGSFSWLHLMMVWSRGLVLLPYHSLHTSVSPTALIMRSTIHLVLYGRLSSGTRKMDCPRHQGLLATSKDWETLLGIIHSVLLYSVSWMYKWGTKKWHIFIKCAVQWSLTYVYTQKRISLINVKNIPITPKSVSCPFVVHISLPPIPRQSLICFFLLG